MSKIKHLYWRAGFGLSPEEWELRQNWSTAKAVNQLFKEANEAPLLQAIHVVPFSKDLKKSPQKRKMEGKRVGRQNTAWLKRMADPKESALLERMCLFWHGHFACQTKLSKFAFEQLNTFRKHALGNFRDLCLAMAKDVSMIRFLNNQQNKKKKPNENFARELMELFTIGRGNYTEQDIKEAARAFTGWSSNLKGEYIFRRRQHDFGVKKFMGKTGKFNGEDIIDIILERRETAHFLCTKIYRYFVNEQEVDQAIINDLARQFYASDYDIGKLMRRIFTSDWFYAKKNIGTKIKSPVELVAGISRSMHITYEKEDALIFAQKALGQRLLNPPNVAGWEGGKAWIDNSTLMLRLNLVGYLLYASNVDFRTQTNLKAEKPSKAMKRLEATVDLEGLMKLVHKRSEKDIVEILADYFIISNSRPDSSLILKHIRATNKEDFVKVAIARITSLPEYQLC